MAGGAGYIGSHTAVELINAGYDLTMEEVAEKAKDSTAWYKQHIFDVLTLVGGLALFLFGMNVMGQALEVSAGKNLRNILAKLNLQPS